MKRKWLQGSLAVLALMIAGLVWWTVAGTEGPHENPPQSAQGLLVETKQVATYDKQLHVQAEGLVRARRSLALRPQVAGEIVWLNQALVAGGSLAEGEEIFHIDPRDYRNTLEQAEAGLAAARAKLALEKGRKNIAEEEWRYFKRRNPEKETGNRELALREPQLQSIQAELAQRSAAIDQAKLNLERTVITSPFSAFVLEQSAAPGLVVNPQTVVAKLVNRDVFDVHVKLPIAKLPAIRFPAEDQKGSAAVVTMQAGTMEYRYQGRVTDLVPAVEPRGRMAQIIVSVTDPLIQNRSQPLLLNTFVSVAVESIHQGEYVAVPREAVHYQSQVYLYEQGRLRIAKPEIIWRLADTVLVGDTLQPGDEVVTSPLTAPVEGMLLRRKTDTQAEQQK